MNNVSTKPFGNADGVPATLFTLTNAKGFSASFSDLGATWVSWLTPDRDGKFDDVLLGCFSRLGEGYLDTELEAISAGIDKLRSHVDRYGEELTKKRKVAGALIGACASGIVILVI